MTGHNPMQRLLRRHLGVDAFALDGDDTEVLQSWADEDRHDEEQPIVRSGAGRR